MNASINSDKKYTVEQMYFAMGLFATILVIFIRWSDLIRDLLIIPSGNLLYYNLLSVALIYIAVLMYFLSFLQDTIDKGGQKWSLRYVLAAIFIPPVVAFVVSYQVIT